MKSSLYYHEIFIPQDTVKLTGLPWNSTAYDIHEALEVNNPKYIFIPRNPNNNKPLNYAIVYYENDEDIGIAAERNIIFCNRTLHWGTPGEKSCHRCGSFDHLISKCDIEPSAKPRVMNRKQKLKEFRQENNKKFKKGSYANVTKQNSFEKRQQSNNSNNYSKYNNGNINRYWNKNISPNDFKKIQQENYRIKSEFYKYKENKSTTSSGKNIKVNQDRSTIALQNENNKRSRVDNEQLEASGSSDIENSLNKQNNEINRFGDALSTMSKNISKIMEYFTSDNNNDLKGITDVKKQFLIDILGEYNITILGLSETNISNKMAKHSFNFYRNNYVTYFANEETNYRGNGVGLIIKKNYARHIVNYNSFKGRIIYVNFIFSGNKKMRIINYYGKSGRVTLDNFNQEVKIYFDKIKELVRESKAQNAEIILLGDFNLHYEKYLDDKNNNRKMKKEHKLFEWIEDEQNFYDPFYIMFDNLSQHSLNTFYPFNTNQNSSRIDYIWVTENLFSEIQECKIVNTTTINTDHRMLVI
ncbi:hypothetical protein GLOIN_2v1780757 [Rhizophagus irregularis DAOM 181602=DAOM 197198]|nr:hypothetical protein GLOIN_2v1780757 [Rhizophagus irregularis DAOM 181602=DAOM 197198]